MDELFEKFMQALQITFVAICIIAVIYALFSIPVMLIAGGG